MPKEVKGVRYHPSDGFSSFQSTQQHLLKNLYAAIDCQTVECVNLTHTVSVWCDEEFCFKQQKWLDEIGMIPCIKMGDNLEIQGIMVFLGGTSRTGKCLDVDIDTFDKLRQNFEYFGRQTTRQPFFRIVENEHL